MLVTETFVIFLVNHLDAIVFPKSMDCQMLVIRNSCCYFFLSALLFISSALLFFLFCLSRQLIFFFSNTDFVWFSVLCHLFLCPGGVLLAAAARSTDSWQDQENICFWFESGSCLCGGWLG